LIKRAQPKPAVISTSIGSKQERVDEIAGR
jgi:hypothetical protein